MLAPAGPPKYPRTPYLPFSPTIASDSFVDEAHRGPSALGGEREGVVIRLACSFPASEFGLSVCKSVRAGHVQTDEHWTRNWRPCRIARGRRAP